MRLKASLIKLHTKIDTKNYKIKFKFRAELI